MTSLMIEISAEIHLPQVVFFKPMWDWLYESGCSVKGLLRRLELHHFQTHELECYAAEDLMYLFFDEVAGRKR